MITLYRPAGYDNPRAPEYAGRSIDAKPTDVENGAQYTEIDTGRVYVYDAENAVWAEKASAGASGSKNYDDLENKPSINGHTLSGDSTSQELGLYGTDNIPPYPVTSVNGKTGDVELTADDVGAMPKMDVDTAATKNSNNLITSGAVESAIADVHSIPTGGSQGQALVKSSTDDYAAEWGYVGNMRSENYDPNLDIAQAGGVVDYCNEHYAANTKPSTVLYSDIFTLSGTITSSDAYISSADKRAIISNGMLIWSPYIGTSDSVSVSMTYDLFTSKDGYLSSFTDSNGQKWKGVKFDNAVYRFVPVYVKLDDHYLGAYRNARLGCH